VFTTVRLLSTDCRRMTYYAPTIVVEQQKRFGAVGWLSIGRCKDRDHGRGSHGVWAAIVVSPIISKVGPCRRSMTFPDDAASRADHCTSAKAQRSPAPQVDAEVASSGDRCERICGDRRAAAPGHRGGALGFRSRGLCCGPGSRALHGDSHERSWFVGAVARAAAAASQPERQTLFDRGERPNALEPHAECR
jgi:hypothetical protein